MLHYAGGGFQEESSIKPVCARMIVCVAVLKTRAMDLSFFLCPSVPDDTTACLGVSTAQIIERHEEKLCRKEFDQPLPLFLS